MTLDPATTTTVVATLGHVSWTGARDCIAPGAVNASMIHRNVTLNPRDKTQDVQSLQARPTALRRVDQEAVLEVEVIPHLISATDLATVAKLSLVLTQTHFAIPI